MCRQNGDKYTLTETKWQNFMTPGDKITSQMIQNGSISFFRYQLFHEIPGKRAPIQGVPNRAKVGTYLCA